MIRRDTKIREKIFKRLSFSLFLLSGLIVFAGVYLDRTGAEQEDENSLRSGSYTFGVQCGAFALNGRDEGYNPQNTSEKIKELKKLGVNTVRTNLEVVRSDNPFRITADDETNDAYINALVENGFDVLLVIDPDIPSTIGKSNYNEDGYNLASHAVERYKGKVKYYQMANEVSGTAIKPSDPNFTGETFEGDFGLLYSKERYNAVLGWTSGMSRAIREKDPDAKIVVSGHWVLYKVIDQLIKDGVDFDIIGWAWYENDGDDVTKRQTPDGQSTVNLGEELAKFGKTNWIIESNLGDGTYPKDEKTERQLEQEQATFIERFVPSVLNSGYFSGYFFFNMFDDPVASENGDEREAHWGLVKVSQVDGKNKIIREKAGLKAYQRVIKSLNQS